MENQNWTTPDLKDGERVDDLQIKGYKIIQNPGRFCFGMDAVLLSSFAKVRKGERALDLGTGTGILPILLEAKNEGGSYVGLEIQKESADMAKRLKNEKEALYIARHEVLCTLDDILRQSSKVLKDKGRFYMVHRPFRLPEILRKMWEYKLEPKRMQLVHPQIGKEPNMVLLEGVKGGNPRLKVEPPLIVYQEDGNYTPKLLEIYSQGIKNE